LVVDPGLGRGFDGGGEAWIQADFGGRLGHPAAQLVGGLEGGLQGFGQGSGCAYFTASVELRPFWMRPVRPLLTRLFPGSVLARKLFRPQAGPSDTFTHSMTSKRNIPARRFIKPSFTFLIEKKRDGCEFTQEEIRYIIDSTLDG